MHAAVGRGILEYADRSPEEGHLGVRFARVGIFVSERPSLGEGPLHQVDANIFVARRGELPDPLLNSPHGDEDRGVVLPEQELRAHRFVD